MRLLRSIEDEMNDVCTYQLSNGQIVRMDARTVRDHGAAALLREFGFGDLLPSKRLPVIHHGRTVGTMAPDFDPHFVKSNSLFFEPRHNDFRLDGDSWIADPALGIGDIEAVAGFRPACISLENVMTNSPITPASMLAAASGNISNVLAASTPGGIERQEAEGQRALASAFQSLPKEMDREAASAFGFVFGDDVDELFVSVTAPAGWAIVPTDHSMHSDIVDECGRKRGSIFYKAAFYDRRANGYWLARYGVEPEYTESYDVAAFKAVDRATGEVLFVEPVAEGDDDGKYERRGQADQRAVAKLLEKFPDYRDVTAYW